MTTVGDELQRQIDDYLDRHWEDVVADIDSLVRIESVESLDEAKEGAPFGPGPRAALDQVLGIASRMGLATHDCDGYMGYADLAGSSDTQIGIIGHVDVVPAGMGWHSAPYAVTCREGYLLGRGVLDDKGPIMVALHAVNFWAERGDLLPYTVRVLFGVNEETGMKDVPYYRERHSDPAFLFTPDSQFPVGYGESGICSGALESARFADGEIIDIGGGQAVNAVPASAWAVICPKGPFDAAGREGISIEECGDGRFRVSAKGVSAHASTSELGVNAIGVLIRFLVDSQIGTDEEKDFLALLGKLHGCTDGSGLGLACADGHFGELTAVGGVIGMQDGRIRQSIDMRYPTTTTASALERDIRDAAAAVNASFTMEHDKEPFLMDPESPAVRALLDAYNDATGENRAGATSKGGTYARTFSVGVSFGLEKPWEEKPDWVGGMHGPDEGVSEQLLKQAFGIYVRTIGNLMRLDL